MPRRVAYAETPEGIEHSLLAGRPDPARFAAFLNCDVPPPRRPSPFAQEAALARPREQRRLGGVRKVAAAIVEFMERLKSAKEWKQPPPMKQGVFGRPPEIDWLSHAVRFPMYLSAQWDPYWLTPAADEVALTPSGHGHFYWQQTWHWHTSKKFWLHYAVVLDQQGKLERVRRCDGCNRWFAAGRKDARFHDRKCKQKNFRSTDEYRRKAARWQREYRKLAGRTGR